jgi:hypothetical protein
MTIVASAALAFVSALAAKTPASLSTPAVPASSAPVVVIAAPGRGIKAVAGNDDFSIQVRARMQLRAEATASATASAIGFTVRRMRLVIGGDMLQKQFTYNFHLGFAPRDLEADNPVPIRDAWVAWNVSTPVRVRFGQMKVPFDRQLLTSSAFLHFPERSAAVGELALDRDVGIVVFSAPIADRFVYQLGVFGGDGRNRLNADDGLLTTARVQWMPLGAFDDDLVEGDVTHEERSRLAVAAAAAFKGQSPRARSTTGMFRPDDRVDYVHATADVLYKQSGFSLLVEGLGRTATTAATETSKARSAIGGLVQVGMMVNERAEVVGRYGHLEPIDAAVDNEDDLVRSDELRVGLNYYVLGHDLKFANDVGATMPDGGPVALDAHVMTQIAF